MGVAVQAFDIALGSYHAEVVSKVGAMLAKGFVTLPCREREVSASQELSGRCARRPSRGHRRSAKHVVRWGRDEMALDVEGIVDGGVCGKKFLG